MRLISVLALVSLSACNCNEKPAPPLSSLKPEPLPNVAPVRPPDAGSAEDRELAYKVVEAPPYGATPFKVEAVVHLTEKGAEWNGKHYDFEDPALAKALSSASNVTVSWDDGVYLAQAAPVFAALDDGNVKFQLEAQRLHTYYAPVLRDEKAFGDWVDEAKPGKVRIVQRADGLELQTNMGKLPGYDPNGPTIPLRGGRLDIATERTALEKLKAHFKNEDVCLLPSFGTELDAIAEVMSGTYRAPQESILSICLVYPRPVARDR